MFICLVLIAPWCAACAAKTPPALPPTPKYPDFLYPAVPRDLERTAGAERVDRGWRFLQSDQLRSADREFDAAVKRAPAFYPAHTGAAYVALARRDYNEALAEFDRALQQSPKYVPALVGKGQALLALRREEAALTTFEAAIALDPSLAEVRRRIDVLRFRSMQEVVESARAAAKAGKLDEARAAYSRAVDASPDSAFLHRELGLVERQHGDTEAALNHLHRALELDPSDAASEVAVGEILEQRMDYDGAEAAYRRAAEIEPSDELSRRIAAVTETARTAKLPPEFREIPEAPQITRGELAALIGIRMEDLLAKATPRQVVITDIRSHWAAQWIDHVARAGVLEVFANHTFQPRTRIRRMDLAGAVSRLLTLVAADRPSLREKWSAARLTIADVSMGHLSYPAVATAVASGTMSLLDGDRFGPTRVVSGAEAVEAIDRVLALVRQQR